MNSCKAPLNECIHSKNIYPRSIQPTQFDVKKKQVSYNEMYLKQVTEMALVIQNVCREFLKG